MLAQYDVKQFKVTKYVMSHIKILFQLQAYAKYSYKNKFWNTTLFILYTFW